MRRGCIGLMIATFGCTPELSPPWLIDEPRELALRISVLQEPSPERSFAAALPGDTIEVTPFVVDESGPVDDEDLSVALYLCGGRSVPCLSDADPPPCSYALPSLPERTCSVGPTSRIVLPEIDFKVPVDNALSYFLMPIVQAVVSGPTGPGATACLRRVSTAQTLDGCFFVSRHIPVASATLREQLEARGIDLEDEMMGPTFRPPRPRNTNPEVGAFEFRVDGTRRELSSGSRVQVAVGTEVSVRWLPDEMLDIQSWEDPESMLVHEVIGRRWYLTRDSDGFSPSLESASWTVEGESGVVYLYLVVADREGGFGWGWLELDVVAGL